jgi:hypothetical protein
VQFEAYHPLHLALVCTEIAAFGTERAAPYHAVSALLTALLAALVFAWLAEAEKIEPQAAALVAFLAVAHPVMVETEISISSQKDLLGLIFGTGALWAAASIAHPIRRPAAASALVLFAALSKSGYAILGPLILLRDVAIDRRPLREAVRRSWAPAALGIALLAAGAALVASIGLPKREVAWLDPVLVGSTILHDTRKLAIPIDLVPVGCVSTSWPRALAGWAIAAAATAFIVRRRAEGWAAFGIALALVGVAPYANLIPTPLLESNRYLTLPVLGLAIALTGGLASKRARIALVAAAAVLAALSIREQSAWSDALSLWTKTAAESDCTALPSINLAVARFSADDEEGAERALIRALAIDPRDERIYRYLALAFLLGGDCGPRVSTIPAATFFEREAKTESGPEIARARGWPATSAILRLRARAATGLILDRAAIDAELAAVDACDAGRAERLRSAGDTARR